MIQALARAAERGVAVRVLFDPDQVRVFVSDTVAYDIIQGAIELD